MLCGRHRATQLLGLSGRVASGARAAAAAASSSPQCRLPSSWLRTHAAPHQATARRLSATSCGKVKVPPVVDSILRGFGQVVFCDSPLAGAGIAAGLMYADPWLGSMALLGCASATGAARLFSADPGQIAAGLTGYNGCLVGCGLAVFMGHSAWSEPVAASTAIVGAASAGLSVWWRRALAWLPQYTLPFNIVTLGTLVALGSRPLAASAPAVVVASPAPVVDFTAAPLDWVSATLCGVSQIFVACDPVCGGLILAGMAGYSPGAAVAALSGSMIGTLLGAVTGADVAAVSAGLWGFNPALSSLMVSIFFVPSVRAAALAVGAAIASAVMASGLGGILASTLEVPCCTVPFCAAAVGVHMLRRVLPGVAVALSPHSPEANLKAFRAPGHR